MIEVISNMWYLGYGCCAVLGFSVGLFFWWVVLK